jgi:muramoyltetrapeptide carboxypeptidase LdcA involved in peptidoglycan recycling
MRYPPKPKPGDRVAVVSPSFGAPGRYPHVYELGLRRLVDDFGLKPVEYPTTRAIDADPSITAVLATVGGDDEIRVVRHLDPAIFRGNPKPYFGYSDNTNLLNTGGYTVPSWRGTSSNRLTSAT